MSRLIGFLLLAEGFLLGLDAVQSVRLPFAAGDHLGLGVVVLRGLVSVVEFAAGLMLVERRPPGPTLGSVALLLSAALWAIELGAGLAPGSVFITLRWPIVWAYWAFAAICLVVLRRADRATDR